LDFISSSVDKLIDELKGICHWKTKTLREGENMFKKTINIKYNFFNLTGLFQSLLHGGYDVLNFWPN